MKTTSSRFGVIGKGAVLPLLFIVFISVPEKCNARYWNLPPLPATHEYGNILINRTSEKNNMKPVVFSHWSHRLKYTCGVCHLELEFDFKTNGTEITEEDNLAGNYCGACHNGKIAFGHTSENCSKCHSGTLTSGKEKFATISRKLPWAPFGNRIDWADALSQSKISPRTYLEVPPADQKSIDFRNHLELTAVSDQVPPAFFPHDIHSQWLDCGNCHPTIFNVKKRTVTHYPMKDLLEEKFCGVCHYKVAFPMNDCARCHPGMKNPW